MESRRKNEHLVSHKENILNVVLSHIVNNYMIELAFCYGSNLFLFCVYNVLTRGLNTPNGLSGSNNNVSKNCCVVSHFIVMMDYNKQVEQFKQLQSSMLNNRTIQDEEITFLFHDNTLKVI